MTIKEIIEKWYAENKEIIEEMRNYKADNYKLGYADGMETALDTLKMYLDLYSD
ncbi:MAG: hypothetical protein H0Z39_04510 [Peptococcaceae bacterium]|nr:hypothetical protein [Peptococcaceae bacterium]